MNAVAQSNQFVGRAKLITPISYMKDGIEIQIETATEIFVDAESEIALIGADHVHVTADEYTALDA